MNSEFQINLNGIWSFGYTTELPQNRKFLHPQAYMANMPVPGYWDDHTDLLNKSIEWSRNFCFNPDYRAVRYPMGSGKPVDASLPYIIGVGWYSKHIFIPSEYNHGLAELYIGGTVMDAYVWINGHFVGEHYGHLNAFTMPIEDYVEYGKDNLIIIAVSNIRNNVGSCIIRGYKGRTGGIYGDVCLHFAHECMIESLYVYPNSELTQINWRVGVRGQIENAVLYWQIETIDGDVVISGKEIDLENYINFVTSSDGIMAWSDNSPILYKIVVTVEKEGIVSDRREQRMGLRFVYHDGKQLIINKVNKYLRGFTEHAYFADSCTPPLEKQKYLDELKVAKSMGFNWIRFHTWAPNEQYLDACDELGMYVQVETANGFKDSEWYEQVQRCRVHPCVIIYCCGNEVHITDELMKRLMRLADYVHEQTPDVLFSPMESLDGVDVNVSTSDTSIKIEPILHNAYKLNKLKQFSDVLEPHRIIGFDDIQSQLDDIQEKIKIYDGCVYLSHELGIVDSYLNLDLENRYEGKRIGTDLFASTRSVLANEGLLAKAPLYYNNSCIWAEETRKILVEKVRMTTGTSGYDYLGFCDTHWHRSGYSCGIVNEFYELKPGQSKDRIRMYNGESVVMLDAGIIRDYYEGDKVTIRAYAALFGEKGIEDGILSWTLLNDHEVVVLRGIINVGYIKHGEPQYIGNIDFEFPVKNDACAYKLCIQLDCDEYSLRNVYNYWSFPRITDNEKLSSLYCSPTISDYARIADGKTAIVYGETPFVQLPFDVHKVMAGRTVGNSATVIYNSPAMRGFPHEGLCDWQFSRLIENASAVVFDYLVPIPFEPIIEVVSTHKLVIKQAALFEVCIGKGRVLFTTLNINSNTPAANWLKYLLMRYVSSDFFKPLHKLSLEQIKTLIKNKVMPRYDYDNEKYIDGNAITYEYPLE